MQINATAREARILVESTIEAIKEFQNNATAGTKFNLSFQIVVAPGLKTDSETLSYLDKLLRSIKSFPESEGMELVFNVPMMHPDQVAVLDGIKHRYEKVVSVGEPAIPKLLDANGQAAS